MLALQGSAFAADGVSALSPRAIGLDVTPAGAAYTASPFDNKIYEYSPSGEQIGSWGSGGTGNGQFDGVADVAVEAGGNVWAYDPGNQRIQEFTSTGTFLQAWPAPGNGIHIALDRAGNILLTTTSSTDGIRRFTSNGTELPPFGSGGGVSNSSGWAGLAVDPDGTVYAGAAGSPDIYVFDTAGAFLRKLGTVGSGDGQLAAGWGVMGLAVDSNHNLWVIDRGNSRIEKFTASGEFVGKFGTLGSKLGEFAQPNDIAVAADGGAFIADANEEWVTWIASGVPTAVSTADSSTGERSNHAVVNTGAPVHFSALGSTARLARLVDYAWDLDGNGTFETDTGSVPAVEMSYSQVGVVNAALRVTTEYGKIATAVTQVDVRPVPPAGAVGASINAGAQYTNDPKVELSLVWPSGARTATISNDGGFANSQNVGVSAKVPWTLDSSGAERLPKTVYVRFDASTQTFQDDIILDQTPPSLSSAILIAGNPANAAGAKRYRVNVSASDDNSGLGSVQFAVTKNAPEPIQLYTKSAVIRSTGRPRYVRVNDRAGNISSWKTIAVEAVSLRFARVKPNRPILLDYSVPGPATVKVKLIRSQTVVRQQSFEVGRAAKRLKLPTRGVAPGRYLVRAQIGKLIWSFKAKIVR